MTPIEKAKELVNEYTQAFPIESTNQLNLIQAKQCALIAVDEMMEIFNTMPKDIALHYVIFYEQVKNEIELL